MGNTLIPALLLSASAAPVDAPEGDVYVHLNAIGETTEQPDGSRLHSMPGPEVTILGLVETGIYGKLTLDTTNQPDSFLDNAVLRTKEMAFYNQMSGGHIVTVGVLDNVRGLRQGPFADGEAFFKPNQWTMMSGDEPEKKHVAVPDMVGWDIKGKLSETTDLNVVIGRRRLSEKYQYTLAGDKSDLPSDPKDGVGTSKDWSTIVKLSHDLNIGPEKTDLNLSAETSYIAGGQSSTADETSGALMATFKHQVSPDTSIVAGAEYAHMNNANGHANNDFDLTYGYGGISHDFSPLITAYTTVAATSIDYSNQPGANYKSGEIGATINLINQNGHDMKIVGAFGKNCVEENNLPSECGNDKKIGIQYTLSGDLF